VPHVRQAILELAEAFRAEVSLDNEGFQFVHLMADTAKVRGRHFLGVCLATLKTFYPWRLIHVPDQTGETLARELGALIGELRRRCLTTCGVVTDNANGEIKTVKLLKQEHSVFRVPCLSHTANLVIKDFLGRLYPGRNALKELGALIEVLPRGFGAAFHGCPTLTVTRWFCLWAFFTYVVDHYDAIKGFLELGLRVQHRDRVLEIFRLYDFRGLLYFFALIGSFIKWTEGRDSTLGTAWGLVLYVHRALAARVSQGVPYAAVFLECFAERFTTTADVSKMLAAYLMTRDGLAWYQSLDSDSVGGCRLTQKTVNDMTASVRRWFVGLTGFDDAILDATWNWYLATGSFGDRGTISFWSAIRSSRILLPGETEQVLCLALGTLGLLMAIVPVSEAGVERMFSHMRDLLLPHRDQMKARLIEARIIVKINNYPDEATGEAHLRPLDLDLDPELVVMAPLVAPVSRQDVPRFALRPS
jgi:hypothetical protein